MVAGDDGDIIRGLGFVTLHSAYLEEEVDRCAEVLKSLGASIAEPPIPKWPAQKLEYCLNRCTELGIDHLLVVTHAFRGGKSLFKRRNDVVHGRTYAQTKGPDIRRSGRPGVPDCPVTSKELYELADDFYETTKIVSQITDFYIPDAVANKGSVEPADSNRRTHASTGRSASPPAASKR